MNFADMLKMQVKPLFDEQERLRSMANHNSMLQRARAEERWRKAFSGFPNLTANSTALAKVSGVTGAATCMRELEKRGIVKCIGRELNGGSNARLVWKWVGEAE